MKYCFIILGPDLIKSNLMKGLWKDHIFIGKIDHIIINEAHCVTNWISFCMKYHDLTWLYSHLQGRCQWYLTSVTLDEHTCCAVLKQLGMDPVHAPFGSPLTKWLAHSNDCPNLHYAVQAMEYSMDSCKDLAFLVPLGLKQTDLPPIPFLVYCNT